jgi:hypothetical protein
MISLFVLFANPNRGIVVYGLKTKLAIAAYVPTAQTRVHKVYDVSLTPWMLHVRTGQSGFLS